MTGLNALVYIQGLEAAFSDVQFEIGFHGAPAELTERLKQMKERTKALEKEVNQLKGKLASSQGDELLKTAIEVKGIKVLAAKLDGGDAKTLRDTMDKLKDKLKTAVIVLAIADGGKVQLAAGVTADSVGKVKAGELIGYLAQQVGGKGGGKPDMAMAGGTDPSKVAEALASVLPWVTERV
jgi:alanyl-tRNA synthetase